MNKPVSKTEPEPKTVDKFGDIEFAHAERPIAPEGWLEEAVQAWIAQGRNEEQIYGVRNFLTGIGGRAIEKELESSHREGEKKEHELQLERFMKLREVAKEEGRRELLEEIEEKVKAMWRKEMLEEDARHHWSADAIDDVLNFLASKKLERPEKPSN